MDNEDQSQNPFQPVATAPGFSMPKPPMPAGPRVMMDGISPAPEPYTPPEPTIAQLAAAANNDEAPGTNTLPMPNTEFSSESAPDTMNFPTESTVAEPIVTPESAPLVANEPPVTPIEPAEAPVPALAPDLSTTTEIPPETVDATPPKKRRTAFDDRLDQVSQTADTPIAQPKPAKKSGGSRATLIVLIAIAIIALAAAGFFYVQTKNAQDQSAADSEKASTLQEQLNTVTQNSSENSAEITKLQDDKKQLQTDLEKSKDDLKTANESIEKNKDLAKKNTELTKQVETLTAENKSLTDQINALNDRVDRLVKELKRFTKNIPE